MRPEPFTAFHAALRFGPGHCPPDLFEGSVPAIVRGLKVHANNIAHARHVALEETYPRLAERMGQDAFRGAVRAFLDSSAILGRSLDALGRGFEQALDAGADRDLARVEWAWIEAFHAAEANALDLAALSAISPERLAMIHLWDELGVAASRNGRTAFDAVARMTSADFTAIGEEYLLRTRAFRQLGRPRFVDKLPANWMNVGLIRLALPNARIIDARRHPMACGWSNFKQHYATGVTFSYSLESIGHFYADYLRLMRHFDVVQPGAVHHVTNEALVDDPEAVVRAMLDYLGLPFDPAVLEFHRSKRAVHTPSAAQVRRPINRDGLEAWRQYEPWLGPLAAALGPALEEWQG